MPPLLLHLFLCLEDLLLKGVVLNLNRVHLLFQVRILLLLHPDFLLGHGNFFLQVLDLSVCSLLYLFQSLVQLISFIFKLLDKLLVCFRHGAHGLAQLFRQFLFLVPF